MARLPSFLGDVPTWARAFIQSCEQSLSALERNKIDYAQFQGRRSVHADITAAGATQATATALSGDICSVSVVAVGATGVRLPDAMPGRQLVVFNIDAADAASVYPATGGAIDALGANNPYSLAAGGRVLFTCPKANQWYSLRGA